MKIFKQFAILGALIALLGITSSCSNDNIEIKSPTKLGYVELSAALPEGSRVVLGDDTSYATPVYWEADDTIVITIGGEEYTFAIKNFVAEQTSALFYSESAPTELEAGIYTATYKATTTTEQSGLKEDIEKYQPMTAKFAAADGDGWDNVTLNFNSNVAVLKLTLSNNAFKGAEVSGLKLRNNGTVVATATSTFTGDESGTIVAYFAVEPQAFTNTSIEVISGEKYYLATLSDNTIAAGNLYQISKNIGLLELSGKDRKSEISYNLAYTAGNDGLTLTLSGEGMMKYAYNPKSYAWHDYRAQIVEVVVEEGVTYIASHAFQYCESLETVSLPSTLTEIGGYAFGGSGLKSIVIPNSVTFIGGAAFVGCESLTSIDLGNGLQIIEGSAFIECPSLKEITLPASLTEIRAQRVFGEGLEIIYSKATTPATAAYLAFDLCSDLQKIYVPASDDDSVINAYKEATGWKTHADKIEEYVF